MQIRQCQLGSELENVPKGVGAGIVIFRRIGRRADPDAIKNEKKRAHEES